MQNDVVSRRTFTGVSVASAAALSMSGFSPALADESLGSLATRKGLRFGAAVTLRQLREQPALRALIERECTTLVSEFEMKWLPLEAEKGQLKFELADGLAQYSARHGMELRGHTLVWHEAMPEWAKAEIRQGRATAERIMVNHIKTMMAHFKGQIRVWDVVNEAVNPAHKRPDGLRITPYLEAIGPEYLDIAFHAAREADPTARLIYNEFGFEQEAVWQTERRSALLKLLEGFRKRGVPCDGLGIQAHLHGHEPLNAARFSEFLTRVSNMAYSISVTELDVGDHKLPPDIQARDAAVADLTWRFLDVTLANRKVDSILTWGLADHLSWLNSDWAARNTPQRMRSDGLPQRPLPFDAAFKVKPMRSAIAAAIANAPVR
jgi:endo-1,4-beta-xylanase